jgi:WD40 repeat protein
MTRTIIILSLLAFLSAFVVHDASGETTSPAAGLTATASGAAVRLKTIDKDTYVIDKTHRVADRGWAIAFSPDGRRLVFKTLVGAASLVELGNPIRKVPLHVTVKNACDSTAAFSGDSKRVAIFDNKSTLTVWDAQSGKVIWTEPSGESRGVVAFSDDGKLLASTLLKGKKWSLLIREADTGKIKKTFANPTAYSLSLRFTSDGKNLVLAGGKQNSILDLETGDVHEFSLKSKIFYSSRNTVNAVSKRMVKAYFDFQVLDLAGKKELLADSIFEHREIAQSTGFSPTGDFLAFGGVKGALVIWDVSAKKRCWSTKESRKAVMVRRIGFTESMDRLLVSRWDGTVEEWKAARQIATASLLPRGKPKIPVGVASTVSTGTPKLVNQKKLPVAPPSSGNVHAITLMDKGSKMLHLNFDDKKKVAHVQVLDLATQKSRKLSLPELTFMNIMQYAQAMEMVDTGASDRMAMMPINGSLLAYDGKTNQISDLSLPKGMMTMGMVDRTGQGILAVVYRKKGGKYDDGSKRWSELGSGQVLYTSPLARPKVNKLSIAGIPLAVSPTADVALILSTDSVARTTKLLLYDIKADKKISELPYKRPRRARWTADGRYLYVAERISGASGSLYVTRVWDCTARKELTLIKGAKPKGPGPDGAMILEGGGKKDPAVLHSPAAGKTFELLDGGNKLCAASGEHIVYLREGAYYLAKIAFTDKKTDRAQGKPDDKSKTNPDVNVKRDPIVGKWRWFSGAAHTLDPEGTIDGKKGNEWRCVNAEKRAYEIRWRTLYANTVYIDTVTLSADGRRLSGSNRVGTRVSAKRLE